MEKADYYIDCFSKFIMGIAVLVLSLVTMLQVIARFVFSNPIAWGQDIIRLSFVYLVFFGGAYCVMKGEHLCIDILLTSLPSKYRGKLNLLIEVILLLFFIFLVYYGAIFTKTGLNQKAPYLSIPMSLYYLALPLSSITMVYFQLRKIFK